MQNPDHTNITGTAINSLYICTRKLWFYQNYLEMEHTSEVVDIASFAGEVFNLALALFSGGIIYNVHHPRLRHSS